MDASEARAQLEQLVGGDASPGSAQRHRRMQILAAATDLFVEQGFKKTSVAEIAVRAGVTKPTVYAHFESKALILLCALAHEKLAYFDRIAPVLDPAGPPRERLRDLIALTLLLAREMPLTSRLMQGERDILLALQDLDQVREILGGRDEASRTRLYDELLAAMAPRLDEGERHQRAEVLVALSFCSALLAEDSLRRGISYERLVELLATIVAAGIDAPLGS